MKSPRIKFKDYSTTTLLLEADEIARSRKWTRSFALYVLYYQAMTAGNKTKAEACMKLLEKEVMGALTNSVVLEAEREYDQDR
jgi:hypothetical protein